MKVLSRLVFMIIAAVIVYAMWAWAGASAATSPVIQVATVIVRSGSDGVVAVYAQCDIVAAPAAHDPGGMAGLIYDPEARSLRLEVDCDPVFRDGFE